MIDMAWKVVVRSGLKAWWICLKSTIAGRSSLQVRTKSSWSNKDGSDPETRRVRNELYRGKKGNSRDREETPSPTTAWRT
jgi:hypothetical protein